MILQCLVQYICKSGEILLYESFSLMGLLINTLKSKPLISYPSDTEVQHCLCFLYIKFTYSIPFLV